jgi:dihydrofolate synthase/folylpolyglutamate synthase
MPANRYQETLHWLFEQFPSYQVIGSKAYKPTLENTEKLLELIGNPQNQLSFIHIAGSNGKGSVSAMLASILTTAGYKTGLFTSPHIVDFRERIRINGEMISENEVVQFCERIRSFDLDFEPSFFEVTFALSLYHFVQNECNICAIETGLGGRLDATNVINPKLSIITSISLEHTSILGDTLEKIAFEKAGIIKHETPVLIGRKDDKTSGVFKEVAIKNNSPLSYADKTFVDEYELPFLESYQKENLATVLSALNILSESGTIKASSAGQIQDGLHHIKKNTGFFGRMEIVQRDPLTIFDVSHNPEGIQATIDAIQQINKGKLHILYGSSADKDVETILQLFPENATITLTTFSNERSLSMNELSELSAKSIKVAQIYNDPQKALSDIQHSANKEDTILVFGSFFLISDFFK